MFNQGLSYAQLFIKIHILSDIPNFFLFFQSRHQHNMVEHLKNILPEAVCETQMSPLMANSTEIWPRSQKQIHWYLYKLLSQDCSCAI